MTRRFIFGCIALALGAGFVYWWRLPRAAPPVVAAKPTINYNPMKICADSIDKDEATQTRRAGHSRSPCKRDVSGRSSACRKHGRSGAGCPTATKSIFGCPLGPTFPTSPQAFSTRVLTSNLASTQPSVFRATEPLSSIPMPSNPTLAFSHEWGKLIGRGVLHHNSIALKLSFHELSIMRRGL